MEFVTTGVEAEFAKAWVVWTKTEVGEVGTKNGNELVPDVVAEASGQALAQAVRHPGALDLQEPTTDPLDVWVQGLRGGLEKLHDIGFGIGLHVDHAVLVLMKRMFVKSSPPQSREMRVACFVVPDDPLRGQGVLVN